MCGIRNPPGLIGRAAGRCPHRGAIPLAGVKHSCAPDACAVRAAITFRRAPPVRGHDEHQPPTLCQSLGPVILGVRWLDSNRPFQNPCITLWSSDVRSVSSSTSFLGPRSPSAKLRLTYKPMKLTGRGYVSRQPHRQARSVQTHSQGTRDRAVGALDTARALREDFIRLLRDMRLWLHPHPGVSRPRACPQGP